MERDNYDINAPDFRRDGPDWAKYKVENEVKNLAELVGHKAASDYVLEIVADLMALNKR